MVSNGGQRAVERCDLLGVAPFSDSSKGLYRGYLTPAHAAAVNQLDTWMREAGMSTRLDSTGNLIGRYEGASPDAEAIVIGSHIDSVHDAGRYDGPLGIMLGLECVAALCASNRRLSFAVEIVAFGDEEGSRFHTSMLCSRAFAGSLAKDDFADVKDENGIGVTEALKDFSERVNLTLPDAPFEAAARSSSDILAYFEPHIEQGPVLENEGLAVAVVSGIAAQLRYKLVLTGEAGHAGTSLMHLRRDALAGASEIVLGTEEATKAGSEDLVATVGRLIAGPGAPNVVPGRVEMSLDVRAGAAGLRDKAAKDILSHAKSICERRGLELQVHQVQDLAPAPCDPDLSDLLESALIAIGQPKRRLVSGAGHDAMVMRDLCPAAMLFIRCERGLSHHPDEAVMVEDVEIALQAMLKFIDLMEGNSGG